MNFDEQILDAAKSIALATKLLVQKASTAQKELVLEGRLQVTGVSKDKTGQFSQGLVSAAQMVARETGSMCEAANDLVKGEASEEKYAINCKIVILVCDFITVYQFLFFTLNKYLKEIRILL